MERSARNTLTQSDGKHRIVSTDRLPLLTDESVHIWTWNQEVDRDALSRLEPELSQDEWRRVRRYASNRVARRFIVRRGMLRRILGLYLKLLPRQVEFFYNDHGKPLLAANCSTPLQFNLSDSGPLVALAVGSGHPLGIDIEQLRPRPDLLALAESRLTAPELEQFLKSDISTRDVVIFRSWTRREAISKAEGGGLGPIAAPFLLRDSEGHSPPATGSASFPRLQDTRLHDLILPDGWVGTLATHRTIGEFEYIDCAASGSSLVGKWKTVSE